MAAIQPEPDADKTDRALTGLMVARAVAAGPMNFYSIVFAAILCLFVDWWAPLLLVIGVRLLSLLLVSRAGRRLERAVRDRAPLAKPLRRFTLLMPLAGVSWALYIWAIPTDAFDTPQTVLMISGIMVGVASILNVIVTHRPAFLSFIAGFGPVAGAYLLMLINLHGSGPLLAGAGLFGGIIVFALGSGREMRETARISAQNERYLNDLQTLNTELERALAEADHHATVDQLTGLFNRRAFSEAVNVAIAARAERGWHLMLVDLDRFKEYNDTYGHPFGDLVLERTGAVISRFASARDKVLAGRIGGEEFAIFYPMLTDEQAFLEADRLRSEIGAIYIDRQPTVRPKASIGVARWRSTMDWSEALRAADEALYRAKHEGRDRVCMEPSIREVG